MLFFEHMCLYHAVRGEVPEGDHTTPIDRAVRREGRR